MPGRLSGGDTTPARARAQLQEVHETLQDIHEEELEEGEEEYPPGPILGFRLKP